MGISINGPSGIDTAYIIDSLVELEHQKVDRVEEQKNAYQVKIDAYSYLQTLINEINSKVNLLKKEDDFNIFTTLSSNEDIVTFSAGVGGYAGSYDINVFQTAQREKLISADKKINSQTEKLSNFGISPGKFSINGTEITISDNDTIQDLRMKINNATDEDGNKLGVTATVLKVADDNFRMVLTSDKTGSGGVEYKDLDGGTFLQDIGIIYDADGSKGVVAQKLRSSDNINDAFAALSVGDFVEYSGVDHDGNEVSNSFLITASSTIEDIISQIRDTFHGMVDVTVNESDGTLVITDKVNGKSELAISSFIMASTDYVIDRTQIGYEGQNILSVGRDTYFSVDGINMHSDKNSVGDFIPGLTFEFHKASYSETVTIKIERDYDAITDKVKELLNAFNALVRYINDSTRYGNSEEGETKGKLAGDMTARMILSQIRKVFQTQFDVTGTSTYSSLTMVGLKTNTNSGEFELDADKFKDAVENSFDEVISLFITKGYSDNPNILMGKSNESTKDGVYSLNEIDDDYYEIQRILPTTSEWYQSETRIGSIISFKDGPANGLSITASIGSGGATFTFSKGLSGHLNELIEKLTDGHDGTITMRQESWNKSIERCEERISRLEDRVESYRLRLVKQFSIMEQMLSQMSSQSDSMMSQLGYYTI